MSQDDCKGGVYSTTKLNVNLIAMEYGLPAEPEFYSLVSEATKRADEQYAHLPSGSEGRSFEEILIEIGKENGLEIPMEAAEKAGQVMLDAHDDYKSCEPKTAALPSKNHANIRS